MNIFIIAFIFIFSFLIFIVIESIKEIRQLNINEYKISHNKLPKEFNGYKLIVISDLHNCFHNMDKIIQEIKLQKPNGVVIAGDMLVYGDNEKENNIKSLEYIKTISKYSDIYFAPGNHEMGYMQKKPEQWVEYEKQLLETDSENIYFLDNKVIELSRGNSNIKIFGLHLTDGYYKRIIKKKLSEDKISSLIGLADSSTFNMLIAHNPDYFKVYSSWGADIVFSGHNHGGLMNLPVLGGVISPRLRIFPKYDKGLFYQGESILVLSGGLGAHSLKIRVNNVPELIVINLIKE